MSLTGRFIGGLRGLFRKAQQEEDLDEELRGYLETSIEQKMKTGMSRAEAERSARVDLGGFEVVKDRVRDVGWEAVAETFFQDFRFAVRHLAQVPTTIPATDPALVGNADMLISGDLVPRAFARPKSRTLTVPFGVSLMSAGFKSRWTIPRSCAADSASATCLATSIASSIGNGPFFKRSESVSPSTSSITMHPEPSTSSSP